MVSAHYKQTETMDSLKNCAESLPLAAFPRTVVFKTADRRHICCSENHKKSMTNTAILSLSYMIAIRQLNPGVCSIL